MHFLGCLFALFLGVILIGVTFLGSIINFILSALGLKNRVNNNAGGFSSQQSSYDPRQHDYDSQQHQHSAEPPHGQHKGKIFQKDESEYVDFEEIH